MGRYDASVSALKNWFTALETEGVSDIASKGGVNEILLANALGHELVAGDKGADGRDSDEKVHEYKVSITNQYNFEFGFRPDKFVKGKRSKKVEKMVKGHFRNISTAICAERKKGSAELTRVVQCDSKVVVKDLLEHFDKYGPKRILKNYSLDNFAKLPGSVDLTTTLDQ